MAKTAQPEHRGIERLRIQNFRAIRELDLELDSRLTVFFGLNASGKTTIHDALRTLLGHYLKAFGHGLAPARRDVRVARNGAVSSFMSLEAQAWGHRWAVSLEGPNVPRPLTAFEGPQILEFSSPRANWIVEHPAEDPPPTPSCFDDMSWVPVVAAYPSWRGAFHIPERERDFREELPRFDGFQQALEASADFKSVLEWFRIEEDIERRLKIAREDLQFRSPSLQWVRHAVETAGRGVRNPRTDVKPIRMLVDFDRGDGAEPEAVDIRALSDGYRTFFGLVIDLARRMAQVNPAADLTHPYKGTRSPSVVLVDEIDLHLHPKWQGEVLPRLLDAFPNTQWIVTTHSEQVIASVDRRHVRELINEGGDFSVRQIPFAQGASGDRILTEIMDVPERLDTPVLRLLRQYLRLVALDEGETPPALEMRRHLDEEIPGDPLLLRADLRIRGFKTRLEGGGL